MILKTFLRILNSVAYQFIWFWFSHSIIIDIWLPLEGFEPPITGFGNQRLVHLATRVFFAILQCEDQQSFLQRSFSFAYKNNSAILSIYFLFRMQLNLHTFFLDSTRLSKVSVRLIQKWITDWAFMLVCLLIIWWNTDITSHELL